MSFTPELLRDPDNLPFAYDHVVTGGDLYRVLNEVLRPILAAVSSQVATITDTSPLTVVLNDGTTQPASAVPGFHPSVGARALVLFVPATATYYAVLTVN